MPRWPAPLPTSSATTCATNKRTPVATCYLRQQRWRQPVPQRRKLWRGRGEGRYAPLSIPPAAPPRPSGAVAGGALDRAGGTRGRGRGDGGSGGRGATHRSMRRFRTICRLWQRCCIRFIPECHPQPCCCAPSSGGEHSGPSSVGRILSAAPASGREPDPCCSGLAHHAGPVLPRRRHVDSPLQKKGRTQEEIDALADGFARLVPGHEHHPQGMGTSYKMMALPPSSLKSPYPFSLDFAQYEGYEGS